MEHWRPPALGPITKLEDHRLNLIALIAIGIVGCLITVGLMLYLPDLALTVDQFNPFAGP